ncbi:TonB-dependent receptor plug domain-containing protein [Hyalangium sp.]|uniref:TonB-dependent receptor plug domain-containing protein n=1 Tax=Hyalangium sp. TaxID=2028555 RepID=UPI002D7312CD|nr:TonB-dependent receptor [Hyalangium sp.]HYH94956.1 TonB-dependent receptor [Hyalangium sp.]
MSWPRRVAAVVLSGLAVCFAVGLTTGTAQAQTKPKNVAADGQTKGKGVKGKGVKGVKKGKTPAPPPAPVITPTPAPSPLDSMPSEDPTVTPSMTEEPAAPAASHSLPPEPPPEPAPVAAPMPTPVAAPAPAAGSLPPPGGLAAEPAPSSNLPNTSPFAGPESSRALPPPSSMAGVGLEDPLSGQSSIETAVNQLLSEAVVTTAGKRNQRLQDVPLTVAWIPAEELEGTGAFTLCEAIQYFPGLECRRGAMRKVAVSARGLGSNYLSNRLLLLKDGRPLTDPWTGQFYADETTPMTNLKQVEVIRGPGSSLYGSNAFSGVINLIERQPADLMQEGRDFGAEGRLLAGQDNTYRVQTTAAGRAGPVEALASYYGFISDGPQLFNDVRTGRVDTNEDSRVHQVSGKVKVKSFSLDADYTNANLGRPGGKQISTIGNCGRCHYTPDDNEHVENLNASVQFDNQVTDNVRVFGQGFALFKRRKIDLKNMITEELQPTLGKRRRFGGEVRALVSLDKFNVTFGGDVKDDLVNNQNVLQGLTSDDTTQTIIGGFVDAEYRPLSRLVLSAGARYDRYQIPENVWTARSNQISPRASIVFHAMDDLTLRTNYGRAFRAPTLAELAINQQMYAATLIGASDLRAETLDTYEVAVDFWPFNRRVRMTATGFYNHAKNFINQQLMFGSTSQFRNIGDARVVGAELEMAAQIPSANSSFDVAYQFLDAQSLPYGGGDSAQLDYAPHHRIYARARTNIGKVGFAEVYGLFVGPRFDPGFIVEETGVTERVKLPSYVTATARVGVNVNETVSLSLLGTNLFDSQYEESHGFPAPPRGVFSEVKIRY